MTLRIFEIGAMVLLTIAIAVQVRAEPRLWRHWLFFWCIWMALIILAARVLHHFLRL